MQHIECRCQFLTVHVKCSSSSSTRQKSIQLYIFYIYTIHTYILCLCLCRSNLLVAKIFGIIIKVLHASDTKSRQLCPLLSSTFNVVQLQFSDCHNIFYALLLLLLLLAGFCFALTRPKPNEICCCIS